MARLPEKEKAGQHRLTKLMRLITLSGKIGPAFRHFANNLKTKENPRRMNKKVHWAPLSLQGDST